jgi:hypothetical protein
MLAAVVTFGLAANGLTLLESLMAVGFGASVLSIAWLWQVTLRRAESTRSLTRRQKWWNLAVSVMWLAVMGVLIWWYASNRAERTRHQEPPAAIPSIIPEDASIDHDPHNEPSHEAGAGV